MSKSARMVAGDHVLKILFLLAVVLPLTTVGQNDAVMVPDEVKPFVAKGMIPIALETGDLNGDGRKDFVLVTSPIVPEGAVYDEAGDGERQTMILVREASGGLTMAARNDDVVMCKNCGGVFGDPFAGVTIKGTRFTVSNYGGSNDRWAYDYTFGYSPRDKTWQLVRVEETSFHALDPVKTEKKHVYTPPKSFGLINFADFKEGEYLGKGKR